VGVRFERIEIGLQEILHGVLWRNAQKSFSSFVKYTVPKTARIGFAACVFYIQ